MTVIFELFFWKNKVTWIWFISERIVFPPGVVGTLSYSDLYWFYKKYIQDEFFEIFQIIL